MFYQINSRNPLRASDELWNDWRWQMSQAIRCGRAEFLNGIGLPAEELGPKRKRKIPPYRVRCLLQLQRDDPQAFKGQHLQAVVVPNVHGTEWSWAIKPSALMAKLPLPTGVKTLLEGRGCQTHLRALENFYPNTDVILATADCAEYCSVCYRQVGDAAGEAASLSGGMKVVLSAVEEVIRRGTRHVLITGGDPMTRDNHQLRQILEPLVSAPSVEVIRIATRMIVHLPMRFFDPELLSLLREMAERMRARGGSLRIVNHVNHSAELTQEALTAVRNIQDCGVELFSQTIVIKGVNDDEATLQDLFMRLDRLGVRPYKLFHTMPVAGTDNLRVPLSRFRQLVSSLHQWIPGTSVPQCNTPTKIGKMPVAPQGRFMIRLPLTRRVLVRNWRGEWHLHEDAPDPKRRLFEFSVASLIFAVIMILVMIPWSVQQSNEQLPFDQVVYLQRDLQERNGYVDAMMRGDFKPFVSNRSLYLPEPR